MRLLNVHTKKLEEFLAKDIPCYAILSHTWGSHEVTFKDIEKDGYGSGSEKVDGCCRQTIEDKLDYVWIDTCCIDKSSSAELSEAINSMWSWYERANRCYAYLSDVPSGDMHDQEGSEFRRSRWFTRGWTLQELLAPHAVVFYDQTWSFLGTKGGPRKEDEYFTTLISRITEVPFKVLYDRARMKSFSVAQKMSWAAQRTTSRVEDIAYSLLGIFGVNMAMLYGEGERAFIRLQEEIMKSSADESIFAWGLSDSRRQRLGLLASSPADFVNCAELISYTPSWAHPAHYSLTNKGLHIDMGILNLPFETETYLGRLNCSSFIDTGFNNFVLPLVHSFEGPHDCFYRPVGSVPLFLPAHFFSSTKRRMVYLQDSGSGNARDRTAFFAGLRVRMRTQGVVDHHSTVSEFYPPTWAGVLGDGVVQTYRRDVKVGQRKLYFLSKTSDFVVRIHYKFDGARSRMLLAQELYFWVALIPKEMTLAGIMIRNGDEWESKLDWCESLDTGKVQVSFQVEKFGLESERSSGFHLTINSNIKSKD